MATTINNNVNIILPMDKLTFCELITHCKIGALIARIGTAVAHFFIYIIVKIYESLVWFCETIDRLITCKCCREKAVEEELFSLPSDTHPSDGTTSISIKEKPPTEEIVAKRRANALARLQQIKEIDKFDCPENILKFDLDAALTKYRDDQKPNIMLLWFDYAMPDSTLRKDFKEILDGFLLNPNNPQFKTVRSLFSKIYYILLDKETRIQNLPTDKKEDATKALKEQIQNIVASILDASSNCIDQTLSQLENIIIEVIATENPLGKNDAISLLQYQASHVLFRHRSNLIKEIIVKDPALRETTSPDVEEKNKPGDHVADIEREVKKQVAEVLDIKGSIFEDGAQFNKLIKDAMDEATSRTVHLFFGLNDQEPLYKPAEYLLKHCQGIASEIPKFRTDLTHWATIYYGLTGNDELSKAIAKDQQALEELCTIAAVDLTKAGTQLLLEAAGIIKES
jgi:hypothetical protein